MEEQVFAGDDSEHVIDEFVVEVAGVCAGGEDSSKFQEEYGTIGFGHDTDRAFGDVSAAEGLGKEFAGMNSGDEGAVTMIIFFENMQLAGEDDADLLRGIALEEGEFMFFKGRGFGAETGQHRGKISGCNVGE